ncbi:MAG TPA: DUF4899 domain-containing protein [Spirochaetota bacterium]|nr:DUF4899 domain-containing protein [Spirochaetota bacterium]HPS86091.1 DUF4899 domain-containing protein [Spirochaetota bacterium]
MDSEISVQSEGNILIVKGRFKSTSMNLYGLFLLSFNAMKKLDSHQVIVSSYSDMYELDPNTPWHKFEEYIVDRKWKGNFNNSMTASIMEAFNKISDDVRNMKILYDNVYNYDYDQMDLILYDLINRIIHDKNLVMESLIQEISLQELQSVKEDRSKPQNQDDEGAQKKDNHSVILQVKPVLAPLNGKPIYELRIGDKIMVKIIPTSNKENYYIDLYNLKDDRGIKTIPATVIDIKSSAGKNNPIEILAELMPGVYGLCIEDEKLIKLKIYDPRTDSGINEKEKTASRKDNTVSNSNAETAGSGKSIMIMGALFVVILFLFILLIMLSW